MSGPSPRPRLRDVNGGPPTSIASVMPSSWSSFFTKRSPALGGDPAIRAAEHHLFGVPFSPLLLRYAALTLSLQRAMRSAPRRRELPQKADPDAPRAADRGESADVGGTSAPMSGSDPFPGRLRPSRGVRRGLDAQAKAGKARNRLIAVMNARAWG